VREGHTLGNHTYSHADLTLLSPARFFLEVDRTAAVVRRLTGRPTRWLRPPYGAVDATTRRLAVRRGYRVALWTVDPQDWRRPGVAAIVGNVLRHTGRGDVVLLHDGGGDRAQTVAALSRVLATMSARGYVFRPLA
jgi:peptidoglycan/xylan/chitin deacetylase (PgdA/CDA1 family)